MSACGAGRPPLAGTVVLDLTRALPGAFCTWILKGLGAEIVKIEPPGTGDFMRYTPPVLPEGGAGHHAFNRGKKSATLNLKHPRGRELLAALTEQADVLVEGFRPGTMDRLGLGYEIVSERNPGLVYCAISGFGADGPRAQMAGHDLNYVGLAGLLHASCPNGPPHPLPVQVADIGGGGLCGALGILAGLIAREKTGQGTFVDVSMSDGTLSWAAWKLAEVWAGLGHDPAGSALLDGSLACYRVYETRDGRHLTVAALEPHFFEALLDVIGRKDLSSDQYAPEPRQSELAGELARVFASRTLHDWVQAFEGVDACVAPVLSVQEAASDPGVQAREMVRHSAPLPSLRPPVRASGWGGCSGGALARLGEHTAGILAAVGVDPEELAQLIKQGVV